MQTKIKFLFLTLAIILALTLSACGGDTAPASNPPPAEEANNPADSVSEGNPAGNEEPAAAPSDEDTQPEEPVSDEPTVSFSTEVLPMFESRCFNCHDSSDRVEGGLALNTYADLMAGGESGAAVVPGDADASYLIELLLAEEMPKRGPKLTPVQVETIITWVNQGAKDN